MGSGGVVGQPFDASCAYTILLGRLRLLNLVPKILYRWHFHLYSFVCDAQGLDSTVQHVLDYFQRHYTLEIRKMHLYDTTVFS